MWATLQCSHVTHAPQSCSDTMHRPPSAQAPSYNSKPLARSVSRSGDVRKYDTSGPMRSTRGSRARAPLAGSLLTRIRGLLPPHLFPERFELFELLPALRFIFLPVRLSIISLLICEVSP